MTGASTTREDVEALAKRLKRDIDWRPGSLCEQAAAILRALLDERDALERVRDEAISRMGESARQAGSWQGIAEGKDIVIRQIEAERDAARAECEAHKARADRYDTEAACASILRAEVERMREALKTAVPILEEAYRWHRDTQSSAGNVVKSSDALSKARAALAGAPSHD